MALLTSTLAYVTADVPGVGGAIKRRPEDFAVTEEPLYEAKGSGEHLYLFIEKRGQTTTDVVRRLAKMFKVRKSDIGYAGMKDKNAVTRQHFSIYLPDSSNDEKFISRIQFTPFSLIWADRHENKLRRGHLAGNRFVIRIREVDIGGVVHAKRVMDRLAAGGVPDFIGQQRYGYRQNNHILGRDLLLGRWRSVLDHMLGRPTADESARFQEGRGAYEKGDYDAALAAWPKHLRHDRQALDALRQGKSDREAVESVDAMQLEFMVNSFQSAIFNRVLDRRVRDGLLDRLLPGDLAWKHDTRRTFEVDEGIAEYENGPDGRVRKLEVSPSGPMWGTEMASPTGQPGQWEQAAYDESGVAAEQFAASAHAVGGRRREMRAVLRDVDVGAGADEHGPYIELRFMLPRGSFATIALREVMKPDPVSVQPPDAEAFWSDDYESGVEAQDVAP